MPFTKPLSGLFRSNGVKVYLYPELMPTPALSFAVRYFKCQAGVVVTASHNPKIYNGYKVYGPDGCQCTDALAGAILEEILAIDTFDAKVGDYNALVKSRDIILIGEDCFDAYMKSTLKQSIYQEERTLNVVYTPLNGAPWSFWTKYPGWAASTRPFRPR